MSKHAWISLVAIVVLGAFVGTGCVTTEKDVKLNQVPAAAKAAIEKETAGAMVKEIEQKTCCGKTCYEVEYFKDGRKVEVKFAEDGSIMTCCPHGKKAEKSEKAEKTDKPQACDK